MHVHRALRPGILAAVLLNPLRMSAQQQGPTRAGVPGATDTTRVDASIRTRVVEEAARLLEAHYVFPVMGREMASKLRSSLASGAYNSATVGGQLALALTRDLSDVAHDRHLTVVAPADARARLMVPQGQQGETASAVARYERERKANYYFSRVEVLPGNIGYLRLGRFADPDSARETASSAMQFLANTDALIIDLRNNPGGAEGLNRYLSSHLFASTDTSILYSRYHRVGDSTTVVRVLPTLPGRRLTRQPAYVLVNARTGSAAENMAYALQGVRHATVVGEVTAGAANSSRPMPLPDGFVIVMPGARVISPVTGTNWEGTGVQPDVRTPSDSALIVAERLARTKLGLDPGTLTPEKTAPSAVPGASVNPAEYIGHYGERTITADSGVLVLQRGGARAFRLVQDARDKFHLRDLPEGRVEFLRDSSGRITALRVLNPQGEWETAERRS